MPNRAIWLFVFLGFIISISLFWKGDSRRWILALFGACTIYWLLLVVLLASAGFIKTERFGDMIGPFIIDIAMGLATFVGCLIGIIIAPRRKWNLAACIFIFISVLWGFYLFLTDSISAGKITNFSEIAIAVMGSAAAYATARFLFASTRARSPSGSTPN